MKIRHKIKLGFLLMAMIVFAIGCIGIWADYQTIDRLEVRQQNFRAMIRAAITATEISGFAKQAEGHLMLYLTLHDPLARESFSRKLNLLAERIEALKEYAHNPEGAHFVKEMIRGRDALLDNGQALLRLYDRDLATGNSFSPASHDKAVLAMHGIASDLQRQGIYFTNYATFLLNRQAAIAGAAEVSGSARRAEGHLLLYLTLQRAIDRQKFFQQVDSLAEQADILRNHVIDPEGRKFLAGIETAREALLDNGRVLLDLYDQERKSRGSMNLAGHQERLLAMHEAAAKIGRLGEQLGRHSGEQEIKQRQATIDSARFFKKVIYSGIISAIIVSLVMGNWIATRITRPLRELQEALGEVGKGRLNTAIAIESDDETSTLAQAFNHMAADLAELTRELQSRNDELHREIEERKQIQQALEAALEEIKTLRGIIPICMYCKGIRDDAGEWNRLEKYILEHSEAEFSHGICPDCFKKYHPEVYERKAEGK